MASSEMEVIKKMLEYIMNSSDIPARELINRGRLDLLVTWYLSQADAIGENPEIEEVSSEITYYIQKINQYIGTDFQNNLRIKNTSYLYYLVPEDDADYAITIDPELNSCGAEDGYIAFGAQTFLLFKTESEAQKYIDKYNLRKTISVEYFEIQEDKASDLLNTDAATDCCLLKYKDCYISAYNHYLKGLDSSQWRELFNLNA